ncbi:MAG: acyl-CoA dehydrogenase family protein [Anaerolineae bacterium]
MDFNLTDEQQFIRETIRKFMARECPRETAHALDEAGTFPAGLLAKVAAMGFCALTAPEAFGGGGPNALGAAMVVEEIATLSPALAGGVAAANFFGGQVIAALGSEAQQETFLPAIAAGERLFTLALSEPDVPPDAETLQTTALPHGDDAFGLRGRKTSVPLAAHADFLLVPAQTADGPAIFIVPADAPGLTLHPTETVGFRGAGISEATLEDAPAAAGDILGGEDGRGAAQTGFLQAVEHLAQAAIAVGLAQGAYHYTANYAGERAQFGQTLVQFEAIQHMLVDLAVDVEAARLLLYRACWLADAGRPFALPAAMAHLRATTLARQAGLHAVQVLGGYGYMAEYDAARAMRDSLTLLSGIETPEVVKNSVGDMLGLG